MKKIEIPEEKLRELYLEKYYSQNMCAKYFNTSVSSIRRKLNEYNIKQDKEMISKKKSLGKMAFTYDEGLVGEYYETLPNELKSLCGELISDRLVVKSKLLKSEMYL